MNYNLIPGVLVRTVGRRPAGLNLKVFNAPESLIHGWKDSIGLYLGIDKGNIAFHRILFGEHIVNLKPEEFRWVDPMEFE